MQEFARYFDVGTVEQNTILFYFLKSGCRLFYSQEKWHDYVQGFKGFIVCKNTFIDSEESMGSTLCPPAVSGGAMIK